jgi:hypothetical protein
MAVPELFRKCHGIARVSRACVPVSILTLEVIRDSCMIRRLARWLPQGRKLEAVHGTTNSA